MKLQRKLTQAQKKIIAQTFKECFADLNINLITDNKNFWQIVKPLFPDKLKHKKFINLAEN